MTFRIRQISETAGGREIVRVQDRASGVVSIGRASDCDVHLPDLAVEPLQALVEDKGDGAITVSSAGTLAFSVDGRSVKEARIDPSKGAELGFGGHRVTIGRDEDGAITLTVRRIGAISESAADLDSGRDFTLASALPSKRVFAWAFFACILLAFLIVPVVSNLTRAAGPDVNVTFDKSWSSGPLSEAHHALEGQCTACHVKPFESVRDTACQSCHKKVHDHADADRLDVARAMPGLGGAFLQKVAHSFGKPGPGACVDCHSEHDGAGRMQQVRQAFCADCHGGLKARLTDSKLGDAEDFGKAHPEFRAMVATQAVAKPHFDRVSLDAKPVDINGLSFSHEEHLAPRGTVTRMAQQIGTAGGYGKALDCANCHRQTADGVRFLPVQMERDCEACHSLAYDKVGNTVRRLRHGDFAQMVADLRVAESPSRAAGLGLSGRDRPGTDTSLYRARFARPGGWAMQDLPLVQAVSATGICGECHQIDKRGKDAALWRVQPVHQTARYFMNGWFDHKPHEREACTSCHGAQKSTKASDLMLPGIAVCRDCHVGEGVSTPKKTPSSCVMCHDYHPDGGAPWFTAQDRRKTAFLDDAKRSPSAPQSSGGAL